LSNGTVREVGAAGNTVPFGSLVSAEPTVAFAIGNATGRPVLRWNGTEFVAVGGQPREATTLFALAGNRVLMFTRAGTNGWLSLWDNGAWTELLAFALPANVSNVLLFAVSPSLVTFAINTTDGGTTFRRFDGSTLTTMSSIGGLTNNTAALVGTAGNVIWVVHSLSQRVSRHDGAGWDGITGLPAADSGFTIAMCGTQPVVVSKFGRVYRREGNVWMRLGTDAENLPNRFFGGATRTPSCSSDGTLRVSGGDGSLARWNGTSWVIETIAPSLRSVRLVNRQLGWAAGGGGFSIYRYNGTSWSLATRGLGDQDRRVGSIAAWADGRMIGALWSSIVPLGPTTSGFPAQGIVRFDGTSWQYDLSFIVRLVNGVWGTSFTRTFAASGDGTVLSFDGGGWSSVYGGADPLFYIDGIGSTYALALGANMRTVRWDGATWTSVTSVAGVTPNRLHVAGVNDAWAAAGTALYRFNGTSWTSVNTADIGGARQTYAIFGTRPNDVYVLRASGSTTTSPRILYRWDGSAWSTVTGFQHSDTEWMDAGHAVNGLAVMTGNNGTIFTSTQQQAAARAIR
jgi:hypothetical protein